MTVVKIIELVRISKKNWQDAVDNAVQRAAKTMRNIQGVDVISWTGKVEKDKMRARSSNLDRY